tara:strand:- start:774 stop:1592 length:819 start_codon:yes stop_codon:yes gene_type:complete
METLRTKDHMAKNLLPDYIQNACDWANMRGWKVFPTHANEKRPCIKDPFGRATNVREEIIDMFSEFPGAGLGVPTGPSNQITVIDVDTKNGVDGLFHLRALEEYIPITGVVRTPSGGLHIYFDSGNLEIPNSVRQVAPNNDVRSAGGYVQGPGTITKFGRYSWDDRYISPIGNLAKMPSGLLRRCMGAKIEDHYDTGWKRSPVRDELMDPIFEGCRNSTMASRIGYLLKKLEPGLALKAAQHINEECCKPPLEERELRGIFHSILKRELRNV